MPADTWLSIDLSHLGLDVDPPGCADHLAAIAARLSAGRRIQVGAEDYRHAEAVLACIETVASQGLADRLGAATHDGVLGEALLAALGPQPVEQLLGVRPAILDDLVARGIPVRVYVPFGSDWFRYWMRRLAESRGA